MALAYSPGLKRIRERLIHIKHPKVRLWQDKDLNTAVFENSSNWFELLEWLLITLDDSIASLLEEVEPISKTRILQDVVIGLGLLQSSEEVQKCVSGKFSLKEREGFINRLISAIELKSKYSQDSVLYSKEKCDSFEEYRSFGKISKKENRKNADVHDLLLTSYEELKKDGAASEEKINKLMVESEFQNRKKDDENLTATAYLEQLKRTRKEKLEELAQLSSSLMQMWQSTCEMHSKEWQSFSPVDIGEVKKMPMLKQISKKVDCLSQHQKTLKTVEKSVSILQEKSTIDLVLRWSAKNTESLPVFDCFQQIHSVKTQIVDLPSNVNLNNTSAQFNNTTVKHE